MTGIRGMLSISISGNRPPLRAGFDAVFNEQDGDTYHDNNKNGRFDAVWIAGFGHSRAAQGVHDDLWARCMVIDDGRTRIAIIALDAISFFHDDVVDVRNGIPESTEIDYSIVLSTHDHAAPDLMGLWGASPYRSGVDPEYRAYVKRRAASCAVEATAAMRPALLRVAQDLEAARELVNDTRLPFVLDPGLRLIQAIDNATAETLGVLVAWADHPETLWSKNLMRSGIRFSYRLRTLCGREH